MALAKTRLGVILALTPQRVINREIYYGYNTLVAKEFGVDIVYVKNVWLGGCVRLVANITWCPFVASLAYTPAELVVGLSKVVSARTVTVCAHSRKNGLLALGPKAIVLRLECKHMRMITRRVKSVCAACV
ncbi:GTP cyclohydrolase 1 [Candidatus Hodgkinia cicadicola]|nr:GTP cyclohydrolase 1 [Candidatus Hodgkinia cicadicola]